MDPLVTMETFARVGSCDVYAVGVYWARAIARRAFVNVCMENKERLKSAIL